MSSSIVTYVRSLSRGELIGLAVNVAIRLMILFFAVEAALAPEDDPRYEGKGIAIRNLIVVLPMTMLVPALHRWRRRWDRYPWWVDNVYLSIWWLDMLGNFMDWYNTYEYFDLIPHTHGSGAVVVLLMGAFAMPVVTAFGLANVIHIIHEIQEYAFDVFAGTENVGGIADTISDLTVGLIGTALYGAVFYWLRRRRGERERLM
jgi:hypothetical protein